MTRMSRCIGAIVVTGVFVMGVSTVSGAAEPTTTTSPADLAMPGGPSSYCVDADNHAAPPLTCPPGVAPGSEIHLHPAVQAPPVAQPVTVSVVAFTG